MADLSSLMDKVKSLRYMECVVKESLRLHPPVPAYERVLDVDMKVNGHTLPAGTEVAIWYFWVFRWSFIDKKHGNWQNS